MTISAGGLLLIPARFSATQVKLPESVSLALTMMRCPSVVTMIPSSSSAIFLPSFIQESLNIEFNICKIWDDCMWSIFNQNLMGYDNLPRLWFAPGCVTSQFNLATNEALLGVWWDFKLLLEEGNGHSCKAGAGAALAGVGNAGAVVVAEELFHLIPRYL